MLRDLIYTTLGAGVLAKERIHQELEELKTKGESSKEKVEQMQQKLEERGKVEEEKLRKQIKQIVQEVVDEMGLVTKDDLKK